MYFLIPDNSKPPQKSIGQEIDVLNNYLALEKQRIEVEKLREKNNAMEIELSAKSAEDAVTLAAKQLEYDRENNKTDFSFKEKIVNKVFAVSIIIIILLCGLIVFLTFFHKSLLEKLISLSMDAIKIILGGFFSYLLKGYRQKNKDQNN